MQKIPADHKNQNKNNSLEVQIVLRKATWIQTFTLTQNTMNPLNQKYLETKISLKQIINFKKKFADRIIPK